MFPRRRRLSRTWPRRPIEINPQGRNTHPFLTLQFLTAGRHDPASGLFPTPAGADDDGHEKTSSPTDHLEFGPVSAGWRRVPYAQLLTETGRIGLTAVGDTRRRRKTYRRAEKILLERSASCAG